MQRFVATTAVLVLLAAALPVPWAAASEPAERGKYLAQIMDCGGCHTPGVLKGKPQHERYLAGSDTGFHVPGFGVSYPPNLTSDPETGLGEWSVEDIMRAVRKGRRPDGTRLSPPMPWRMYSALTDRDARALARYIKQLPAVEHATPEHVDDPDQATSPFLSLRSP